MTSDIVLLYCPCPDEGVAAQLARQLIEEGLIACANILPPHRSLYLWNGALEEAPESLLLAKTNITKAEQAATRLKTLHPYEIPCVLQVNAQANARFTTWVESHLPKTVASPEQLQ